ncbi:MAG: DUF86 domain-containing protein, partial [Chitinophagaceae bacterium]
ASNRISKQTILDHPEIDWRKMLNFRNLLIHEYFGVNNEIVWDIIQNYLPHNLHFISAILKK